MIAEINMAMLAATLASASGADRPSASASAPPPTISAHQTAEADYSVAFPSPFVADSHVPQNTNDTGYWSYTSKGAGTSFSLRIDQFPASIRAPTPTPPMYALLLRGYAAQAGSRLQSTRPVQVGDRSGLEGVLVDASGETEVRDVLMVGHRVYQVSYRYARGVDAAGPGRAFLGSLKIASH